MCGFYPAGKNQVSMFFESGTWGSPSGTAMWLGQVQSFDPDTNINLHRGKYLGTTNDRNVDKFQPLAKDVDFNLEFYPQDWRLLGFALGSVYTHNTGSPTPPVTHQMTEAGITQLNGCTSGVYTPFPSFALEGLEVFNPTGLNINKQLNGCNVDTYEIAGTEGDFLTVTVNGMAKNLVFTSGTGCALVELTSPRPFLWRDAAWYVPSGTNNRIDGMKSWSFLINNGLARKNYNGTGNSTADALVPLERSYDVSMTMDKMSQHYKTFNDAYISGTAFNMMLSIVQNTGSNYLNVWMSGCVIDDQPESVSAEGLNEMTVAIKPQTCNALAADSIDLYRPW